VWRVQYWNGAESRSSLYPCLLKKPILIGITSDRFIYLIIQGRAGSTLPFFYSELSLCLLSIRQLGTLAWSDGLSSMKQGSAGSRQNGNSPLTSFGPEVMSRGSLFLLRWRQLFLGFYSSLALIRDVSSGGLTLTDQQGLLYWYHNP